jgi:valyl-tRNA synthetase
VSVALAPYPTAADGRIDESAERHMNALMRAITAARSARSEHDVPTSARIRLVLRAADAELQELLRAESRYVEFLVRTEGAPTVEAPTGERPRGMVLSVAGEVEVLVDLRGLVDAQKERDRVDRAIKKVDKDLGVLGKRLDNPKFVDKAPPEVVAEAREQQSALGRQRARLEEARAIVDEL